MLASKHGYNVDCQLEWGSLYELIDGSRRSVILSGNHSSQIEAEQLKLTVGRCAQQIVAESATLGRAAW